MSQKIINIGILTPYVDGYYFGGLIKGIRRVVEKEGARLVVIQTITHLKPSEKSSYNHKLGFNYMDGWIVIFQSIEEEYLDALNQLGKPIIMLGFSDDLRFKYKNCQYVSSENFYCVKTAISHFTGHGHKRIGFVGCFDIPDIRTRFEGYLAALSDAGILYDPNLVFRVSDAIQTGGNEAAETLLNQNLPCTAVFVSTELNATGLMERLSKAGYSIPDDMAVISLDSSKEFCNNTFPRLSSIHQNIFGMGATAAEALFQRIKSKRRSNDTIFVDSELILRNSCGCSQGRVVTDPLQADKEKEKELKFIEFIGNVIINNYKVGNSLTKSNSTEIKSLSWLADSDYHWACLGLWDRKSKNLVLDQCFNFNEKLQSPLGLICTEEDFPPVQYLPDSTYLSGNEIVWIRIVQTEKVKVGMIALVGPFIDMKLLASFDLMVHSFDLMALSLEREILSESRFRSLLDNVGQGFLSIDDELFVDREYSLKCKSIFQQEISGKHFPDLIYPNNAELRDSLKNNLYDLFGDTREKKVKLFLDLLPGEMEIHGRNIKFDYKLSNVYNTRQRKKLIVVLTDITDKKKLENKIENERNVLKMVVKSVTFHNEFIDIINDYIQFCQNILNPLLHKDRPLAEKLNELLYYIKIFKANFAQLEMTNVENQFNHLECEIQKLGIKTGTITDTQFQKYISDQHINKWIKDDLCILRNTLGDGYFNFDNTVIISESQVIELEKKIISILSTLEFKALLPKLRQLRYKPFKDLLKSNFDYTMKLAERLEKSICPIDIKDSGQVLVNTSQYYNFIKSLVHVFRNAVDHGIEMPDERIENRKSENGCISCGVKLEDGKIHLVISDDGKGINTDKIRQKLVEKGIYDVEDVKRLPDEEVMGYIFHDNFSTKDNATNLSGRGVGLAVVKSETEKLNGEIRVQSEPNQGTTFEFIIPHRSITNIIETPVENIMEDMFKRVEDSIARQSGCVFSGNAPFMENRQKVSLHDYTLSIDMKGLIYGNLLISCDENMIKHLRKKWVQGETEEEENPEHAERVLLEYADTVLADLSVYFRNIEDLIIMESPIVMHTAASSIKHPNSVVWMYPLNSAHGEFMISFISYSKYE